MMKYKMNNGRHVDEAGTVRWFTNGILHREDGPALITCRGSKHWHINGLVHREDGPAIIYYTGERQWYLYNIQAASFNVFLIALSKSLGLSEFWK